MTNKLSVPVPKLSGQEIYYQESLHCGCAVDSQGQRLGEIYRPRVEADLERVRLANWYNFINIYIKFIS